MLELIKALIKAKAEFQPIQKDRINPHFKTKYASLDSVLDAVTPALCKYGLVIVQPLQAGRVLNTHLYHESGEVLTSTFELPDFSDIQKIGSVLTYARRYSVCALLGITADEDNDGNGNAGKGGDKPVSNPNQLALSIGDNIRQIREFLNIEKEWVIHWLKANDIKSIAELKEPNKLINDMAIYWAVVQGIASDAAAQSYAEIVKSPDLTSVQKWQTIIYNIKPPTL